MRAMERTVAFWIWAQPHKPPADRSVYIKTHPLYCISILADIVDVLPPKTSRCEVYNRLSRRWETVSLDAGRKLQEEEREVCLRMCGLSDDECLDLPTYVLRSSAPGTVHPQSFPNDFAPSSCPNPYVISVSDPCPVSMTTSSKSLFHSHKRSAQDVEDDLPHHHSTDPSPDVESSTPSPSKRARVSNRHTSIGLKLRKFPSEYRFSAVYDYIESVSKSTLTVDNARAWQRDVTGISCGRTAFNDARRDLALGNPDLWRRFLSLGDTRRKSLDPAAKAGKLPWEINGFTFQGPSCMSSSNGHPSTDLDATKTTHDDVVSDSAADNLEADTAANNPEVDTAADNWSSEADKTLDSSGKLATRTSSLLPGPSPMFSERSLQVFPSVPPSNSDLFSSNITIQPEWSQWIMIPPGGSYGDLAMEASLQLLGTGLETDITSTAPHYVDDGPLFEPEAPLLPLFPTVTSSPPPSVVGERVATPSEVTDQVSLLSDQSLLDAFLAGATMELSPSQPESTITEHNLAATLMHDHVSGVSLSSYGPTSPSTAAILPTPLVSNKSSTEDHQAVSAEVAVSPEASTNTSEILSSSESLISSDLSLPNLLSRSLSFYESTGILSLDDDTFMAQFRVSDAAITAYNANPYATE
ncbi:hypothetical protein C8Q80DRAFT_1205064 [Daedaleopsis nitida]|nr:hypothetical protein C8Q80DRAFT_1205064 [Daedaleopsis nitida]